MSLSDMVSILILTKDEQRDLPECLKSVWWSDDIHVLDSFSSDLTPEIARAFGAKVVQRKFDDWSSHQNWAVSNINFKYPWVFYLDADERMSDQLVSSVLECAESPGACCAFRVQRRDFYHERWLKRSQATASYIRLFRPSTIRYERVVNPVTCVNGRVGDARGYLDHFPFSKGLQHWFARHNAYSSLEAEQIFSDNQKLRTGEERPAFAQAFFSTDPGTRRRYQKRLFNRLPARPLVKFILFYVARGGFLDGREGFHYCLLQSVYEVMIVLKYRELNKRPK